MPIGSPGCPEFALCTASIASTRSAAAFIQWSGWDWRSSGMFTGSGLSLLRRLPELQATGVAN